MKNSFTKRSLLFVSLTALAILPFLESHAALEIVEPTALCDRFEKKDELELCQKFVAAKKPDTYFASACQSLNDAKLFMKCLETAAKAEVDPKQLDSCGGEDVEDPARWSCLQKLASQKASQFQRMPASAPTKGKVKSKSSTKAD